MRAAACKVVYMKLQYRKNRPKYMTFYSPQVENFGICRTSKTVTNSGYASAIYRVFLINNEDEYRHLLKIKNAIVEQYFGQKEQKFLSFDREETRDIAFCALRLQVCGVKESEIDKFVHKLNKLGHALSKEVGDNFRYEYLRTEN